MNISGVLVHADSKKIDQVKNRLIEMPGVEVHAVTENGRLVVTVEEDDEKMMADTVLNLHHCEGVLSAVMVYQYGNDNEDFEEEIEI
ncbi:chaperone NapD [Candidatus Parabeggiatoa sp. HSG14]|uniref:chaperone NapD n=1 Tax=Candidatus Parabeggiatoa sp. HSG14 TaxID=3055593 RepID=UPI0025A747C6|nr:chaperone NapD [Thiotrichales bacterium HSG14]